MLPNLLTLAQVRQIVLYARFDGSPSVEKIIQDLMRTGKWKY